MRVSDAARLTKLILLIDGENLPSKFAGTVLAKAATLGTIAEGRVYGHFSGTRMSSWAKAADDLGLTKVDVARTTPSKNAADFRLVIEAMDMMRGRPIDGFCLASSDGDFSALCERIRAAALLIYGFGEKKAPESYRKTCSAFFDCADLVAEAKAATRPQTPAKPAKKRAASADNNAAQKTSSDAAIVDAVKRAKKLADGWSRLTDVGTLLSGGSAVRHLLQKVKKIDALETRTERGTHLVRPKSP